MRQRFLCPCSAFAPHPPLRGTFPQGKARVRVAALYCFSFPLFLISPSPPALPAGCTGGPSRGLEGRCPLWLRRRLLSGVGPRLLPAAPEAPLRGWPCGHYILFPSPPPSTTPPARRGKARASTGFFAVFGKSSLTLELFQGLYSFCMNVKFCDPWGHNTNDQEE